VDGSDGSDGGDGGDGDSKFGRLLGGDSSEEHHSDEFFVVGSSLKFAQLLDNYKIERFKALS